MATDNEKLDERTDSDIKVSDRRMFTPSGELREEYRDLERADSASSEEAAPGEAAESPSEAEAPGADPAVRKHTDEPKSTTPLADSDPTSTEPASGAAATGRESGPAETGTGPTLDMPGTPGEVQQLSFLDLVGALAEPAAAYLGDAQLPDGRDLTDLRLARHYIDLLAVLQRKTAGNLTAQESKALEDLLYHLRMRYVQKQQDE